MAFMRLWGELGLTELKDPGSNLGGDATSESEEGRNDLYGDVLLGYKASQCSADWNMDVNALEGCSSGVAGSGSTEVVG